MPVNKATRNGGIEKLAYDYCKELAKTAEVTLAAPKFSYVPGVKEVIETVDVREQKNQWREDLAYKAYRKRIPEYDCVHDMSHKKIAGRLKKIKGVFTLWHPAGSYPEPTYNLMAMSKWQADRMSEQYKQVCRFIHDGVDTDYYCPPSKQDIQDYFVFIGHPAPTKGMIEAINYCRKTNQKLHIIGGQVPAEETKYRDQAMAICDGKQIVYMGEVSNEVKRSELQRCRAYVHTEQQETPSSLSVMEAMSCGAPTIALDRGCMPELVNNEVGVLCKTEQDFLTIIANKGSIESFDRKKIREQAVKRFSLTRMATEYLACYGEVAAGTVW